MPKKYHIEINPTPLDLKLVAKFKITRGENCINCGKCTKVCIYEAHKRSEADIRKIAEPYMVACKNCFRCIQECPRGALVKSLDPEFQALGGPYWKPDMFLSIWKQAEDGKVPVSGAGYRGPFTGPGFDGMWTDMSEIVRPTRDGIHGREYISTAVELGRKLNHLEFDASGALVSKVFDVVNVPIPIILDIPSSELITPNIKQAIVAAAKKIDSFVILPAENITDDVQKNMQHIIPLMSAEQVLFHAELIRHARVIAIDYSDALLKNFCSIRESVRNLSPALVIVRIPASSGIEERVVELVRAGVEIVQIAADYCGMEVPGGRYIKDVIRAVHLRLVDERVRDEISIIASGGIAMAEHVPKACICGADLTAVGLPLLIALGALVYQEPEKKIVMPEGIDTVPVAIARQRIVNLMGAWHSQILEMMGAMGIREARRLRGETGRAIFFDEIDKDIFGKLFQNQEAASV
ncbi:MAG: alpha-hydroxy-acid oxidizing protein [Deltaproteobacteria bacterium]|nr:alpha-hydroxy-acid oxidizing protein [Deltaproteobacteria bacterium]